MKWIKSYLFTTNMGLGFGSLKQMNDTIRHNRALLGKKKSAREIYKDEIKKRTSNHEHQNIEYLRQRVAERIKRNRIEEFVGRIAGIVIVLLVVSGVSWMVYNIDFSAEPQRKYQDKQSLFKTIIYHQPNGSDLKTEYFIQGPKAMESLYKGGLRHQNSESYYESGHQFRSALYYYDTLITEVYFFQTGDTIKNFPAIVDNQVHSLKLVDKKRARKIEFDFYDGKIIQGTYKETWVE